MEDFTMKGEMEGVRFQKALSSEKYGLKQYVPTRWFSEFDCVESVMQSIDSLTMAVDNFPKEASNYLNELSKIESRVLFKELSQVIQPLKECSKYFQIDIDVQRIVDSEMEKIISVLPKRNGKDYICSDASSSPQATPKRAMTFVEKCLSKSSAPSPISLIEERIYYERDSRQCQPQIYWPMVKSIYPKLGKVAWKFFGVPTTESDVERSFSILKNVYTSNRLSLESKFLENLMLIKEMP
ncbi:Protein CBG22338 [Caenorhabditis briggsae]|uniref:Protein CBG22338 n=1 Tax=Caenorhabditis briggsae TaxID=6238 RepID=A8Y266_CAEBR|nr:Protein CBG22338 [Caenorhabditis briggsae]CAP38958.1 Protein CBG22338 [Caenorhabditis briggsae]